LEETRRSVPKTLHFWSCIESNLGFKSFQSAEGKLNLEERMNVKIECDCGQHYSFDAEPVNGQMGSTVACPTCGADGTAAANVIISSKLPATLFPSAAPASTGARVRLQTTAPDHEPPHAPAGVRVDARSLGLVDRATAETEARAKISWGDSREDVIKYLMLQGFTVPEARELVQVLYQERLAMLRGKGIRKIVIGCCLMCVPVIAWGTFIHLGIILVKAMAIAVMVGLYGVWELINGILMLVAPKMESGDVAD
jgi:hypothetical protein